MEVLQKTPTKGIPLEKIKQIAEKPLSQESIRKAKVISQRLRLHTEPEVEDYANNEAFANLTKWWFKFVENNAKQERMLDFAKHSPLPTVETVEKVWQKINRIWETDDTIQEIVLDSPDLHKEAQEYLSSQKAFKFIREDIYDEYKVDPNAFVVIDLPQSQEGSRPDPYPYLVSSFQLLDYDLCARYGSNYIFYKAHDNEKGQVAIFIEDQSYHYFKMEEDNILFDTHQKSDHGLGFMPAEQIGSKALKTNSKGLKTNIVVNTLGELDWYLFMLLGKKYQESYGFMMIQKLPEKCKYDSCVNGKRKEYYGKDNEQFRMVDCEECKERSMIWGGTVFNLPDLIPGEPVPENAIKFITPPVDYLDFFNKSIAERESKAIHNIVGVVEEPFNNQAKNEKQIESGFESRRDILMSQSYNFQQVDHFMISTMLKLRYGSEFIEYIKIYGHNYYLTKETDLIEELKLKKEANANEIEIMDSLQQINDTRYRHNIKKKEKAMLLSNLEPWATLSIKEVKEYGLDAIDPLSFIIKANFKGFIQRFEREYAPITEYGSDKDIKSTIKFIQKEIQKYGTEVYKEGSRVKPARISDRTRDSDNENGSRKDESKQESRVPD